MFVSIGRRAKSEGLVSLLLECHVRIRTFSRLAVDLGRRADLTEAEILDASQRCERYFTEAMPLHIEDEEKRVLPLLWGRRPEVDAALTTMQAQHADHVPQLGALLDALRSLRREPEERAHHRERLRAIGEALVRDFEEHLEREERVIFPLIDEVVAKDVQLTVMDEMRARRQRELEAE